MSTLQSQDELVNPTSNTTFYVEDFIGGTWIQKRFTLVGLFGNIVANAEFKANAVFNGANADFNANVNVNSTLKIGDSGRFVLTLENAPLATDDFGPNGAIATTNSHLYLQASTGVVKRIAWSDF